MFASFLGTISNAFADTGLQLHPDDQHKLKAALARMENYENQLARMCSVLINIVKIARFYGVGLDNIDRDHPRIINLKELGNLDDLRDFVRGYARDLTRNMVANMTIQQSAAYELMNKVGPRLLDDCTGRRDVPQPPLWVPDPWSISKSIIKYKLYIDALLKLVIVDCHILIMESCCFYQWILGKDFRFLIPVLLSFHFK